MTLRKPENDAPTSSSAIACSWNSIKVSASKANIYSKQDKESAQIVDHIYQSNFEQKSKIVRSWFKFIT